MSDLRRHYSTLPPIIKILLVTNIVVFLLEMQFANNLIGSFALWPLLPDRYLFVGQTLHNFELWQLLSYAFLHGSFMHLFLNMYALWLFGAGLENLWGSKRFAIYYFVCVIGAALAQLLAQDMMGQYTPTVGASGGVFGVLLAFGLFFPNQVLYLLIPPMPIKAKWFVIIYGLVELVFGVTGTAAGVAHFAHLGGMLFGFVLIVYWMNYSTEKR